MCVLSGGNMPFIRKQKSISIFPNLITIPFVTTSIYNLLLAIFWTFLAHIPNDEPL
jgi:hypothetical protein